MKKKLQFNESIRQLVNKYFDTLLVKYERAMNCAEIPFEYDMIVGEPLPEHSQNQSRASFLKIYINEKLVLF